MNEFDDYNVSSEDDDDQKFRQFKKDKLRGLPTKLAHQLSKSPLHSNASTLDMKGFSLKEKRQQQLQHVMGSNMQSSLSSSSSSQPSNVMDAVNARLHEMSPPSQRSPNRSLTRGQPQKVFLPSDADMASLSRNDLILLLMRTAQQANINAKAASAQQETNSDSGDPSSASDSREWSLKFSALQEQLHKALEESIAEKGELESRIGLLEFEHAELETLKEEHVESEKQAYDKKLLEIHRQYERKISVLQSSYNDTLKLFEKRLEDKEVEFVQRFKKWKSWEEKKKEKRQQLSDQMAFLEQKLMETLEANQLEKSLMLERLSLAKTELADAKTLISTYERTIVDLRDQLENVELEYMTKEAKLQSEWNQELEEYQQRIEELDAPGAHNGNNAQSDKQLKQLQEQFKQVQRELQQTKMQLQQYQDEEY